MALIDNYSQEELKNIIKFSYSYSEVLKKLGYSTTGGKNSAILKKRIQEYNIDISHFRFGTPTTRTEENIFIENSTAAQKVLRNWYKKGNYTEYKCSICGQEPIWNGQDLTLILDHINGCNNDDRLENLRWVCPNCNQQLETTGFKKMRVKNSQEIKKYYCKNCGNELATNSKTGLCFQCSNVSKRVCDRPNREELKKLIRALPFTQIAKKFGVTDNAVRKWCISYGLPKKSLEIKNINDKDWESV